MTNWSLIELLIITDHTLLISALIISITHWSLIDQLITDHWSYQSITPLTYYWTRTLLPCCRAQGSSAGTQSRADIQPWNEESNTKIRSPQKPEDTFTTNFRQTARERLESVRLEERSDTVGNLRQSETLDLWLGSPNIHFIVVATERRLETS